MTTGMAFCLALQRAHASLQLKLDDELGLHHGISFSDFILLDLLARADGGALMVAELVRPFGQPPSAVLRQIIKLEKIGLVIRGGEGRGRHAALRPPGQALVSVARETAGALCGAAVAAIGEVSLAPLSAALAALTRSPALV